MRPQYSPINANQIVKIFGKIHVLTLNIVRVRKALILPGVNFIHFLPHASALDRT